MNRKLSHYLREPVWIFNRFPSTVCNDHDGLQIRREVSTSPVHWVGRGVPIVYLDKVLLLYTTPREGSTPSLCENSLRDPKKDDRTNTSSEGTIRLFVVLI